MPYLRLGFGDPVLVTSSGTYTISTGTETLTINVSADLLPSYDTTDIIGVSKTIRRGFTYLQGSTGTPSITSSVINEYGTFSSGSYSLSATDTDTPPLRLNAFAQTPYDVSYGSTLDVTLLSSVVTVEVTYEDDVTMCTGNVTYINTSISKRGFCYTTEERDPDVTPTETNWIVYEEPTSGTVAIMTENWNNLDNWTVGSEGQTCEINPAGYLHIVDSIGQVVLFRTSLISMMSSFEIEITIIFDQLGAFDYYRGIIDTFFILIHNEYYLTFATNGIFLFKMPEMSITQIGTVVPSCNGSAEYQTWKFNISGSTLELFLTVDSEDISQGTIDFPTFSGDYFFIDIMVYSTSSTVESHMDVLKINRFDTVPLTTGTYSLPLSAVSEGDSFRVRAYVEDATDGIVYGNVLNISSYVLTRYWINDTGSWDSTYHWSFESGGASGAPVPTSANNITFDSNSFSSNGKVVTLPTTGSFNECLIENDCPTFTMNIGTSLTCFDNISIDNNDVTINGCLIINDSAILYGSCTIENLYAYKDSSICGNNTIGNLYVDVDGHVPGAIFYFGTDSTQTIDNFSALNTGVSNRAVLCPSTKPNASFTTTPTISLSAGNDVELTWSTNYTSDCLLDNTVVGTSDSSTVNPLTETTYELVSRGSGGRIKNYVTVNVAETIYNDSTLKSVMPELVSMTSYLTSPSISGMSDNIPVGTVITLSHESSASFIYYTKDTTTPSITSSLYTEPITASNDDFIGEPPTMTIKAVSYASGNYSSITTSASELMDVCTAEISYTTLQMQVSQEQTLSVINSTCGGAPYTWASSSGSLSSSAGNTIVFTAPSSNVNCDNNATITLSYNGEVVDSITIAVNAVVGTIEAVYTFSSHSCVTTNPPLNNCTERRSYKNIYYCNGTLNPNVLCSVDCRVRVTKCTGSPPYTPPPECSSLLSELTEYVCGEGNKLMSDIPDDGVRDVRSEYYKSLGCCPVQLL